MGVALREYEGNLSVWVRWIYRRQPDAQSGHRARTDFSHLTLTGFCCKHLPDQGEIYGFEWVLRFVH